MTVARFFGHLWPLYCKNNAEIELLEFWHVPPHASPFYAAVVWDAGKWVILADENEEPRTLFRRLFHELGHVRNGSAARGASAIEREVLKRAATGCMVTDRKNQVVRGAKASKATVVRQRQEAGADSFAAQEVARWWPVLEGLGEGATDQAMKWAIDVNKAIRPIQNRR